MAIKREDLSTNHKSQKRLINNYAYELFNKKMIMLLFLLSIFSSFFIGNSFYNLIVSTKASEQSDSTNIKGAKDKARKEEIQFKPINKVAYIADNKVFIIKLENPKAQEIPNLDEDSIYSSLAWKNPQELSFAKCKEECSILTYDLAKKSINEETKINSSKVYAIRWSHNGKILAIFSKSTHDQAEIFIYDESGLNSITKVKASESMSQDFDSKRYIRFSPNDENILVVNSSIENGESTIQVFDLKGKKQINLKGNSTLTDPFFMSNDTLYYKEGEKANIFSINTKDKAVLSPEIRNPYGINPSLDRTKITYWTTEWSNGESIIWTYDIGKRSLKMLADRAINPHWINDNSIIYQDTQQCLQCNQSDIERQNLNIYLIDSGEERPLVKEKNITEISANNL